MVDRSLVLSLAIGRLVTLSKTLVLLETIAGHVSFLAQTSYLGVIDKRFGDKEQSRVDFNQSHRFFVPENLKSSFSNP